MKARALSGAIRRAARVYVWINYSDDDGDYFQVAKWTARLIVE